jgi:hypothetical protein
MNKMNEYLSVSTVAESKTKSKSTNLLRVLRASVV